MNVARGKTLPPGIAKRELPDNLLSKLPARPGYDYVAVGDDVVLLDKATGVVADILANVLH
jgi:Ni/Co efflux regulator RcnB